ncbi:hypothetical protein BN1708_018050, partial [Verticillium longisporum]
MAPLTETISAPATPSPGRSRGHMRSHHTINTWTWQPGMKKSFSIGYRADCEKCRLKVPGHFNHIIGLEEVGGYEGWWEREGHWGPESEYTPFAAAERVQDAAVLEVLTRQAVVEALAFRKERDEIRLSA